MPGILVKQTHMYSFFARSLEACKGHAETFDHTRVATSSMAIQKIDGSTFASDESDEIVLLRNVRHGVHAYLQKTLRTAALQSCTDIEKHCTVGSVLVRFVVYTVVEKIKLGHEDL